MTNKRLISSTPKLLHAWTEQTVSYSDKRVYRTTNNAHGQSMIHRQSCLRITYNQSIHIHSCIYCIHITAGTLMRHCKTYRNPEQNDECFKWQKIRVKCNHKSLLHKKRWWEWWDLYMGVSIYIYTYIYIYIHIYIYKNNKFLMWKLSGQYLC